jgi:anti-sigma factor ChrR (cupin superfamily)
VIDLKKAEEAILEFLLTQVDAEWAQEMLDEIMVILEDLDE